MNIVACLIEAPHTAHDWSPAVPDPAASRVLHVGLATLRCPGRAVADTGPDYQEAWKP